ncbi:hypothetical protein [Stenotrophomonas humi]|uniref:hypothetical protein n=1 Tax=Stenotrophomonas humi TaxID=405444 RepID=UPI000AE69E4C|nr:hypothetical protein [Stenotrophomonas humi]
MDLESYIRASSGWLIDITTTFDLASAAELAIRPNWSPPANGSDVEGPYLISMRHPLPFAAALPFGVRSSREAMRAAWVACGHTPETANTDGVKVPFSNGNSPRIEGVLARAGIIAQFELWKSYATQFPGYPTNLKAAKKHSFVHPEEERLVTNLISIRNRMTHEIDVTNDPTTRMLVNYTWECQHIAKWLTQLYPL